ANGVAEDYGFWLGDAFASGGSAGYDHKEMGITARGAWEAVKRHFRELGKDIQNEPFTTIGVGDMSGDVFGNGMLLSRETRLIAAFDHRDIFLDPDPQDLEQAFAERKRLFEKPGSSWQDYDRKLISPGGGVFSRQEKLIKLSDAARRLSGLEREAVTPAELISALLTADCELLFFGGIGTFIKAARESHADVADKANDNLRVNAEDVRAKVIGEGANLGVTQAGRIAFARKGGRIDTDAIDNSAGVDTSDHEVNIKILLADAIRDGALKREARNDLLMSMTGEVARHVLRHNYEQTLALTLAEATAPADLDAHERFIKRLESAGHLNRHVETLPSETQFGEMRERHRGLTRPDLAKILAYAKIDLKTALIAGHAPDDPAFEQTLLAYFSQDLRKFEPHMRRHRLRREIIATSIADDLINVCGPTFPERAGDIAQAGAASIAIGFAAARALFAIDDLRARINALDTKAPAAAQTALHLEIAGGLRRLILAFVKRKGAVADLIERYRPAAAMQAPEAAWTEIERGAVEARVRDLCERGAPEDLASAAARLAAMAATLDIVDLAAAHSWPAHAGAALYHAIGGALSIDRLRARAGDIPVGAHWERLALRQILDQLGEDQRIYADSAMAGLKRPGEKAGGGEWGGAQAHAWLESLGAAAAPTTAAINDLMKSGPLTFAKMVLAASSLRALTTALQRSE
ncbi:MAG TPA: NAD-glutamate dehydrogenase domain-containing protein, partial [Caulobacterales bacterium]|nr:NAD-glutamate dehydrogenase domain-containing protein [Caulobacterales bacterium]